jgi:hypothetical protein
MIRRLIEGLLRDLEMHKALCALSWHDWHYWQAEYVGYSARVSRVAFHRECRHCGKDEFLGSRRGLLYRKAEPPLKRGGE